MDSTDREIFTADTDAKNRRRFTLVADEKFTSFLEFERAIGASFRREKMKYWETIADNLSKPDGVGVGSQP